MEREAEQHPWIVLSSRGGEVIRGWCPHCGAFIDRGQVKLPAIATEPLYHRKDSK